jgi:hypothetical protein
MAPSTRHLHGKSRSFKAAATHHTVTPPLDARPRPAPQRRRIAICVDRRGQGAAPDQCEPHPHQADPLLIQFGSDLSASHSYPLGRVLHGTVR